MSKPRRGGWRTVNARRYMRIRIGAKKRETIPLPASRSDADADARCALIAELAGVLLAAGRVDRVRDFAVQLGEARTEAELAGIRKAIDHVVRTANASSHAVTFAAFAKRWTDGDLARLHPDHVAKIDQGKNAERLEKHINPHIGPVPLARVTLEDAERVMAHLPEKLSPAMRRHVAQIMHRVLTLAVFPVRAIGANPLPKGFMPRIGKPPAAPYLYPSEDAKLLACKKIPLERRLAWGILAREGMRASEILGSDYRNGSAPTVAAPWSTLDLKLGSFRLDENKTDDPRAWSLDAGVVRALQAWHVLRKRPGAKKPIFPTAPWVNLAKKLRADLELAGITRPELFDRTERRTWMKAHCLRASFVTISLANGKTETWVADRTGHTSSGVQSIATVAPLGRPRN